MKPATRILSLLMALSIAVAPHARADTPPAADPLAELKQALPDLGHADYARRRIAQQKLDAVPWQSAPALQQLADAADDAEIQAHLLARLDAIHVQLATDPPPISLVMKDAPLSEIAAALAKATGTPVSSTSTQRFSINATNQSFVAILNDLNRQSPLYLDSFEHLTLNTEANFYLNGQIPPRPAFTPAAATFCRFSYVMQTAPDGTRYVLLQYTLMVDPRIRVVDVPTIDVAVARDESGHDLQLKHDPKRANPPAGGGSSQYFTFDLPARNSTLTRAKGTATLTVAVSEQTKTFTAPETHVGKTFTLGKGATFTLSKLQITDTKISYDIKDPVSREDAQRAVDAGNADTPAEWLICAELVDATGRIAMTLDGCGGSVSSDRGLGYKAPYTLRLSVPTRTKNIQVPFELGDISVK